MLGQIDRELSKKDNQACDEYYPDLDGLNGDQLYHTLSTLLADTHTTTLSYKKARLQHLYPWIDLREGGNRPLKGIYSNEVFDALEIIRIEAQMEFLREQAIRERVMHESLEAVDDVFLEELEAMHPFNCNMCCLSPGSIKENNQRQTSIIYSPVSRDATVLGAI